MPRLPSADQLAARFRRRVNPAEQRVLAVLQDAAHMAGSPLYLVGGSVRDLVLGRGHLDLDFAVEADARLVATAAARATQGHAVLHDAFRTATVTAGPVNFDLVTARREWYPEPGALPVVEPATIFDDLARRDFTINAMALRLDGPAGGTLVDPHGGMTDLAGRSLRILHPDSFRDDPTRLWRAGRYLARLRLRLDPETAVRASADAGYMDAISPARVHHELQRTLGEHRPDRAFAELHRRDVLNATLPGWTCSPAEARALRHGLAHRSLYGDELLLAVLLATCHDEQVEMAVHRLALTRRQALVLRAMPGAVRTVRRLMRSPATPGSIAPALQHYPPAALAALALRWPAGRGAQAVWSFLHEWRQVRPRLTAEQVQTLGVRFGPQLGEVLRQLRAARLDGTTHTLDDEQRLVRHWLAERGDECARHVQMEETRG